MDQQAASVGCRTCPFLEAVTGSCGHYMRDNLVDYIKEHPETPCPVYETHRAQEMQALVDRIEQW